MNVGRAAIPPLEALVSRREINRIMAVETAELSEEDHTKLLERNLRTGRAEAGRALAAIGAGLAEAIKRSGDSPDEDADVLRTRRALHNALSDPRSGLEGLRRSDETFRLHLVQLGLMEAGQRPKDQEPKT